MKVHQRSIRAHRLLFLWAGALLFIAACEDGKSTPGQPDSWPDSGVFDLALTPDAPQAKNHCIICHSDQDKLKAVADVVPPPPPPTGES